jgi:hypothetical protein
LFVPFEVYRKHLPAGTNPYPTSWAPDGNTVLFQADSVDLLAITRGAIVPMPILSRSTDDYSGQFSPDGRAILYVSNESGQPEVYVATWPDLSGRTPVSTGGGFDPRWSRNGREVFYRRGDALMAAGIATVAGAFRVSTPQQLFSGSFTGAGSSRAFDVAPDGQRFVMIKSDDRAALRQLTVVQNWTASLGAARSVP